jgi:hypothetical protein
MALLTKRELSEVKLYILGRLAADDFTDLECREMVGLLKLTRSGFWQNSFVTGLLCDYGAGKRHEKAREQSAAGPGGAEVRP